MSTGYGAGNCPVATNNQLKDNDMTKKQKMAIRDYLCTEIEFFERRVELADDRAYAHHSNIEQEDRQLIEEIWDKVAEWCEDEGVDFEKIGGDIQVEDILFID